MTQRAALAFTWGGLHTADLELAHYALPYVDQLGGDHKATLLLRFRVASAHYYLGQYELAEGEYRQVLDARIRIIGPDHPNTLTTRHERAVALHRLGQADQARQEFLAVLAAEARVLGPEHPATRATASWIQ